MGSNSSSSSTSSSSTADNSDCYLRNKMMRQQCLKTRSDNEYINPKPCINSTGNLPPTQQSMNQIGCDYQGNVVECDGNGRIIRVIKQVNR